MPKRKKLAKNNQVARIEASADSFHFVHLCLF